MDKGGAITAEEEVTGADVEDEAKAEEEAGAGALEEVDNAKILRQL